MYFCTLKFEIEIIKSCSSFIPFMLKASEQTTSKQ